MKTKLLKLIIAVMGILLAGECFAALPLTATRTNNFSFTVDGTDIPLNNSGATVLTFSTSTANEKVAVSYNAECSYISSDGFWLSVDILIDGQPVAPTAGTGDAMCSAYAGNWHHFNRSVANGVFTVPRAGTHVIQVKGRLGAGTGIGWLSDSSLIIWR